MLRKAIAEKRQTKQAAKCLKISSRVDYVETKMQEKSTMARNESLKNELMQLASLESGEDSVLSQSQQVLSGRRQNFVPIPSKKAKRGTKEDVEDEVQEFMKSLRPSSEAPVSIMTPKEKKARKFKGGDCAEAILKLIDSM